MNAQSVNIRQSQLIAVIKFSTSILLELSVRWYTVVYIPDVYIECLPRVS
jgi:hypothetical protein